jgi:type I restriction enzyme S subunit
MSADLKYLPNSIALMFKLYSGKLELKKVSDLVEEQLLFVEDGNHGEYRPLTHEFVDEGVPFVRPPNLINGIIDLNECQKINDEAFRRVRKGIGRGGDIVLTHNATIGRVAITKVTEPVFVTNPQTTVWRSIKWDVIDPKFLYYFMCSAGFQEQLEYHKGRNATFDYVSLTKQRSLIIPVLEISIQREIADTLSLLDDKIELNRQVNQTLEQTAQTIFKSWFADFEPVKAKIEAKAAGRDPERAAMCAISGKLEPELDQLPPERRHCRPVSR